MMVIRRPASFVGALVFGLLWLATPLVQGFDPQPEDFAQFVSTIQDPTQPLPKCSKVGVTEALGCSALCEAIEGGAVDTDNSRSVNGLYVCTCENQVACNDEPTCAQLTIQPGRVMEACSVLCGDNFTAVEDSVQYSDAVDAANNDMTHFVMECRCNGEVECKDFVLFSDVGYPETCESLEITSTSTCDDYCASEGGGLFDVGGNYTATSDGLGTCDCLGTTSSQDVGIAQACTDSPTAQGPEACSLANPCPTQAPNGTNGTVSSSSSSAAGTWNWASRMTGALVVIVGSQMVFMNAYN